VNVSVPLCLCGLLLLIAIMSGCGKRGAPIPPNERVRQRVEITGFQRGNEVILSWQMPRRNAPKGNVQNIARIDIYRLADPASAPTQISEEDFSNRATLITVMPVTDTDFGVNKTLQYKDTLQFAGQAARLRYAVRLVNASGQKASFSNVMVIEPTSKVAANPASLLADVTQDAIGLKWQPPTTNVDQSTPVSILGYNVYRSDNEKTPARLLNKTPVQTAEYADEFFDFGKEYFYFVRSVSVGLGNEPVESTESNILKIKPVDTFAPSAPAAITLASAPGTISIFWAVNPEKDIAGYKIYRSEDKDAPLDKWPLLTPEIWPRNTYQDTHVESGKRYFYYLTATDKFGNVSPSSDIVSETAP
jgi:fibronectin type 3 domain-containing protein